MRKNDYVIALLLCLLGIFIWVRDPAWLTSSDDTLPILTAIPLFIWMGYPWQWRTEEPHYSIEKAILPICLFVLGIALNLTLLLSISWVILLNIWLSQRLKKELLPSYYKLLILPLMAFPWVALDFNQIGWWFRLSGAWVTEYFFIFLGAHVQREGTLLIINRLPISIEVACAGLNTLQSMFISGTVVAYLFLKDSPRYWMSLPFLFGISWIANTIRIIVICLIALSMGAEFVMGSFHIWSGWGVLMLMFFLCWHLFSWLEPVDKKGMP